MPKRIDQVVYYCDMCGHCVVPEGAGVVDATANAGAHICIRANAVMNKIEIPNHEWKFNAMNTFEIPFFQPASNLVGQNALDGISEIDVRNFLELKKVYLCKDCAEKHGPQYIDMISNIERWATDAGLL